MADGIAITPGVGTTVATDDAGAAGHVQIQKLAISTDGSATLIPADATYGLDVDVTRIAAGTNYIGKTRVTDGTTDATVVNTSGTHDGLAVALIDSTGAALSITPPGELTASPTIYSAGACAQYDSLHTTIMTFSGAANANGGTGRILGARLICKHDSFAVAIALHLFRKSVTGTTGGDALAVSDTDKLEMVGTLTFDFAAFPPLGGGRVATADRSALPLDYKCDTGTSSLFGILQLVGSATPTFAAADLVPFLSFIAD
jgi:hypothetical protein